MRGIFSIVGALILIGSFLGCYTQDRGAQVRLTKRALNEVLDVELRRLERELRGRSFEHRGSGFGISYSLKNARINTVRFPRRGINLIPGVGVRAFVSDASVEVISRIQYRIGFFMRGTTSVNAEATKINLQISLGFGADSAGRPIITSQRCNGQIGDVDLHFPRNIIGALARLISRLFKSPLISTLNTMLCDGVNQVINQNVKSTLRSFPVTKKIDKWALIDYRLTAAPIVTNNYMDILVKGGFSSVDRPKRTSLRYTPFSVSKTSNRMLSFWLSEYTANTAGEVYHNTGRLYNEVKEWIATVPVNTRRFLNSDNLKSIAPSISEKYPHSPIGVTLRSYKAPRSTITAEGLRFTIFVRADLVVRSRSTTIPILGMNMDVGLKVNLRIENEKLIGKIRDDKFSFKLDIDSQYRKIFNIPQNSEFINGLARVLIVEEVNVQLQKGLPLLNLDSARLKDFTISFHENAVQIGANAVLR